MKQSIICHNEMHLNGYARYSEYYRLDRGCLIFFLFFSFFSLIMIRYRNQQITVYRLLYLLPRFPRPIHNAPANSPHRLSSPPEPHLTHLRPHLLANYISRNIFLSEYRRIISRQDRLNFLLFFLFFKISWNIQKYVRHHINSMIQFSMLMIPRTIGEYYQFNFAAASLHDSGRSHEFSSH